MRNLFLLRGCPASGKSTFIKQNGLEPYTLSADNIRTMYQSPKLGIDGKMGITQSNDGEVWELLMYLLENRMKKGELIIIDATHYKSELLNRYKSFCSKYRYRAYVIDFTGVELDELIRRNNARDEYKQVPEEVLHKMFETFKVDTEVSKRFNIITPDEAVSMIKNKCKPFDFNQYDKVVVFGDIHGCYAPVKQYFDNNPMVDNNFYIFTGDYIDRGIQNKEVLQFLLTIYKNKNVLLLEGNHEIWLRKYAHEEDMNVIPRDDIEVLKQYMGTKKVKAMLNSRKIPNIFLQDTRVQLEDLNKKDLRQLCDKLGQMAYFNFGDKTYLVCHGGIPVLPSLTISTQEIIKGVGKYENIPDLYESWCKNTGENDVLIHAHRNIFDIPIEYNSKIYNLCDEIEYGKNLRVIEINKDNSVKHILIKNEIYNQDLSKDFKPNGKTEFDSQVKDEDIIKELEQSKFVQIKTFDNNIKSYNFTREAFKKDKWNHITCTARGLFVDGNTNKVIMRSYNKFFNWGQVEATKSYSLVKNLVFPVKAYRKENGFLGMVSYNPYTEDFLIGSKSTIRGEYADMVRTQLYNTLGDKLNDLKQYVKSNNCTMVFEVIDNDNDPHIIKYSKPKMVLLDVIKNQFEFQKLSYDELCIVAKKFNLEVKQLEYTFNSWQELYDFKHKQDISYDVRHEGWVFEDQNGFMTKYKTRFYNFWKFIRGVKQSLQGRHEVRKSFQTKEEVQAYNILKRFTPEELQAMSILDIEDIFYNEYNPEG